MKQEHKIYLYDISDINWQELAMLNIHAEDIEAAGQMDRLLRGERTDIISFQSMTHGLNLKLDASLQIVEEEENLVIDILGVKATDEPRFDFVECIPGDPDFSDLYIPKA